MIGSLPGGHLVCRSRCCRRHAWRLKLCNSMRLRRSRPVCCSCSGCRRRHNTRVQPKLLHQCPGAARTHCSHAEHIFRRWRNCCSGHPRHRASIDGWKAGNKQRRLGSRHCHGRADGTFTRPSGQADCSCRLCRNCCRSHTDMCIQCSRSWPPCCLLLRHLWRQRLLSCSAIRRSCCAGITATSEWLHMSCALCCWLLLGICCSSIRVDLMVLASELRRVIDSLPARPLPLAYMPRFGTQLC